MKKSELRKLYKYDEKMHAFLIEVQLEDYRDAYSEWDFSPFVNRDLDEDLTEYLISCSYEIPIKYQIIIHFYILNQEIDQSREERSIIGMRHFFAYQIRKLRRSKIRIVRDMITFTIIGGILLLAGTYVEGYISDSVMVKLFSEGLFIGGWVMLWEMFSEWFFGMSKIRNRSKHFKRLNASKIIYLYNK